MSILRRHLLTRRPPGNAQANAGLPNEQIGYQASEQYASRLNTPHSATFKTLHSNSSQPHVESPLRKASFPVDADAHPAIYKTRSHEASGRSSENALESETEDDDVYVAPPTVRKSKIHGNGYDPPTENLGPTGGNTEAKGGYVDETGYGVPILASDEVARTPGAEYMQPAVSPAQSRRGSSYYTGTDQDNYGLFKSGSRSGSASNSRPSSRPGSVHGFSLSRFPTHDDDRENVHTPLEDVDEYEPLFPEEDGHRQAKPATGVDRVRLRDQMKRFPSQDIWEDTPNSLQLQATVDTPEPVEPRPDAKSKTPAAIFETPEQEAARKGEVTEEERANLLPKEERIAKSHFKPHIRDEMSRPTMKQRFPSRDIWEDSPDSAELTTTVGEGTSEGQTKVPDAGLEAGAVVQTSGRPIDGIIAGDQTRDGALAGGPAVEKPSIPPRPNRSKMSPAPVDLNIQPPIPARPPKRLHQVPPADAKVPMPPSKLVSSTSPTESKEASPTEARKGPALPDRAKPQVPGRPMKSAAQESGDTTPLSKVTSASSVGSEGSDAGMTIPPGAPKPKPAVPARPAGNKIAALQGGFLADLNSRLKLGPQGPKIQDRELEAEEEKIPLTDARKGRAKGPMKRKPVAPVADAVTESEPKVPKWTICPPATVWQTDAKGAVTLATPTAVEMPAKPALKKEVSTAESLSAEKPGSEESLANTEEMQQAKLAVEQSIHATHPLKQDKITTPETVADLPSPIAEPERNPLSIAANSPVVDSPTTGPPSTSLDSQTQTGEKNIIVNPGTESRERITATLGGEAQIPPEKTGNDLVRE